jgi:hypothetical protein
VSKFFDESAGAASRDLAAATYLVWKMKGKAVKQTMMLANQSTL